MIQYSTEANSPVVEITVEGRITNDELRTAINRMHDDIAVAGKTRIIEVIRHFTGMEPKALWSDVELGVPLAHKVTRVAVVADAAWIRAATHLGRFFTKAELKVFEPGQLDDARRWISKD